MGYHIKLDCRFRIEPPLDNARAGELDLPLSGWQLASNGAWLDASDDLPAHYAERTLQSMADTLASHGYSLQGSADWQGEDEATGSLSLLEGRVVYSDHDGDEEE